MKPRIFIGSSSEGIAIANQVKDFLEKTKKIDCIVWNNIGVFPYNKSAFESLLISRLLYDFVVLIATKDDFVRSRGLKTNAPRDNVIFEFGLFLGALGESRTMLLQEEGTKLPSDFNGITLPRFSIQKKNIDKTLEDILSHINDILKLNEFQILPSTSLAVGYFNNFLKQATSSLIENSESLKIKDSFHPCSKIKVIIPNELSDNIAEKAKVFYNKHGIEISEIQTNKRPFKVQFAYDNSDPKNLIIVDMPTTINTIRHCCILLLKKSGVGTSGNQKLVEEKEISNFKSTLENLIEQNDYCKKAVTILFESDYL